MIDSIKTLRPKYIRIHDSGEFFSQKYVDDWETIAKKLPTQTFYAYTKRKSEFNFSKLMKLPNVTIIDSLHNGTINYGDTDKLPKGMFLCPDYKGSKERQVTPKGPICGETCTYCMTKEAENTGVYFVKH
jgi:hypothetical protein